MHTAELHILVHVACAPGSVLLQQLCDTFCASGFVDDVMFLHNGPIVRRV